jgi:hypothetical protein|tara:strand:- start:263 stop:880 length:618 start_codon:yes stop_codon:yes gene_type:complete
MNQRLNRNIKSLDNFGYYSGRVPKNDLDKIKEWCEENKHNKQSKLKDYNKDLAGFVQSEYLLDEECKDLVLPYIYDGARSLFEQPSMQWKNKSSWVNYQKKYEVNPLHNHAGLLSYVMWINIPYNLEDELNSSHVKNSTLKRNATAFTFVYSDIHGALRQQPFRLDKRSEGKFIVFHSQLFHMVYPFYTSDGDRISIAGNIEPKN